MHLYTLIQEKYGYFQIPDNKKRENNLKLPKEILMMTTGLIIKRGVGNK